MSKEIDVFSVAVIPPEEAGKRARIELELGDPANDADYYALSIEDAKLLVDYLNEIIASAEGDAT